MDERESGRAAPLVCITDGKHHIRKFLREALSEYNFTLYEWVELADLMRRSRHGRPISSCLA